MTAVKWAILVVAALAALPAGRWLRRRPGLQLVLWSVVGFLPFYSTLDMGLISWGFPGDTHGLEVGVIDWLALTLLLTQERSRALPYRVSLTLYALVALLAVTQALWPLGAFGYVWKLGRMYLLFAAICRSARDERVPLALLRGLTLGILYECLWTVWQHFGLHIQRAMGTFNHENTLGMLVNLVVMAPIALLFAGRATRLMWLAPLAALPISLFTVSRGAILFLGLGSVLVYVGSVARGFERRKALFGMLGLVVAAVLIPLALSTVSTRSQTEREDSMRTRASYERAASLMLEDHPLGVGPGHFTVMVLSGGYGDRAGVDWTQRLAIVHNVYLLTAAEMGYPGVVALLVLFAVPALSALRWSARARRDPRGDLLLGFGIALLAFYAHSFFEWTWRITAVTYVYWMVVGMVAGLTRQLRDAELRARAPVRRRLPVPRGGLRPADAAAGGYRSGTAGGHLVTTHLARTAVDRAGRGAR